MQLLALPFQVPRLGPGVVLCAFETEESRYVIPVLFLYVSALLWPHLLLHDDDTTLGPVEKSQLLVLHFVADLAYNFSASLWSNYQKKDNKESALAVFKGCLVASLMVLLRFSQIVAYVITSDVEMSTGMRVLVFTIGERLP